MKKADMILMSILLFVGVAGCVIFLLLSGTGAYVQVVEDGRQIAVYSLRKDGEYLIKTENGGENLLKIENGTASIISANCPNRDCVYHKAVSTANESIICLPHKLVITVREQGKENATDAHID